MEISPYPMVYVPDGAAKPAHLAPGPVLRVNGGAGPDRGSKGGFLFGPYPDLLASADWQQVPAAAGGWWILAQGQKPQQLRRLAPHPALTRWHTVRGAGPDEYWRVPRLIELEDEERPKKGYISALDRIWRGGDTWEADPALVRLQERLLAIALGHPVAATPKQRNQVLRETVLTLMQLGHHVAEGECIVFGWLSERVMSDVLYAAMGRLDLVELPPEAAARV